MPLRRQALGIIQIIPRQRTEFALDRIDSAGSSRPCRSSRANARDGQPDAGVFPGATAGILTGEGIPYDVIDAVLAVESDRLPICWLDAGLSPRDLMAKR